MASLQELYSLIHDRFSWVELKELCLALHIDFDDIRGENKSETIIGLLLYAKRRDFLQDVINYGRRQRPQAAWPRAAQFTAQLERESAATLTARLDLADEPQTSARRVTLGFEPLPPPDHFIGRRRELRAVVGYLTGRERAHVVALCGMGGVGKTAMAQQVAARVREHFPAGVLWVDSARVNNGGPIPLLEDWSQALGKSIVNKQDPVMAARSLLAAIDPFLMILDDVSQEWLPAARLLAEVRPAQAFLLLTTRAEHVATFFGAHVVNLDVLAEEEALRLLVRLAGRAARQEGEVARQIAQQVDYLPLALELAGRRAAQWLKKPGWRLASLLAEIRANPHQALALSGRRGLNETFAISYLALNAEEQAVFRALGQLTAAPVSARQVAMLTDRREGKVAAQLDDLVGLSLLRWESLPQQSGPVRYGLHPLLHDYARQLLPPAERNEYHRQLEATMEHCLAEAGGDPDQVMAAGELLLHLTWTPAEFRRQTVGALLATMERREVAERKRRAAALLLIQLRWLDDWPRHAGVSFEQFITYLELVTRFVTARSGRLRLLEDIQRIFASVVLSLTERQRMELLVQQAAVYGYLRQWPEARASYEQARLFVEETLMEEARTAEDHRLAARIYLGLGNLSRGPTAAAEALAWYGRAIEAATAYRAASGEDSTLETTIFKEWSHACLLLEQWTAAEAYYERAVQAAGQIGEPSSRASYRARVLETGSNLAYEKGLALLAQGRKPEALISFYLAYLRASEGISQLEGSFEELRLALAHYNCGDYLLKLSEFDPCPLPAPRQTACRHWQTALALLAEQNDGLVRPAAEEQLRQYCQPKR